MMKNRIVDEEIMLVRYYPNYKTTLEWYQDLALCKQVDNRDTAYDLDLLKRMYKYLNKHGDLFYIKYKCTRSYPFIFKINMYLTFNNS